MVSDDERDEILRVAFPWVDGAVPADYRWNIGTPVHALLYGSLYWPDLFEFGGAVFVSVWGNDRRDTIERLTSPSSDSSPFVRSWKESVDSFNVFELPYLFGGAGDDRELERRAEAALADVLVQTWVARLRASYPQRTFDVRHLTADDCYDARITVTQLSPELVEPAGWDTQRRRTPSADGDC
ncbi:hypothetical protein GCM10025870_01340 [Agromyces marinus]|uniref:Uncharacterized protein n=2 Tax=Agromyces marinus TaxID=1389020 RepID=A0ABM8GX38_9MICO|nr:hypothetical protein GCM10025870_01340 [Agromyces marinus]